MKSLLIFLISALLLAVNAQAQCWEQVVEGNSHTLAIKSDGTLWASRRLSLLEKVAEAARAVDGTPSWKKLRFATALENLYDSLRALEGGGDDK